MMKLQKQFDKALFGIRKQKYKPSVGKYGECKYRHGHLKCSVGHIIPDGVYTNSIENTSVDELVEYQYERNKTKRKLAAIWISDNLDIQLVKYLQKIHDTTVAMHPDVNAGAREFEQEMQMLAEKYQLVYTHPNKNDRKILESV